MSNKNYTNLTVNPCKMCMPMGAVTAFYGIQGCMSIIHGSQGCSTYIRRHMATHYNEPVDIASSSLTEQGTVYGGEKNLIAGVKNLIKQYHPKVVGICTTCLAETIGEDVPRIIAGLQQEPECKEVTLISVPSPGYGGTQYEGFLAAVKAMVTGVEQDSRPHNAINVVTSYMSPGEMRELKKILDSFGLEYILLPDISENLDRIYSPVYEKLPVHGTPLADISRMAGARFTIEIGIFGENYSVGEYLQAKYGVPYARLPLPIGLRGSDQLFELLSRLSGREVPEEWQNQRGRYLDAMVDNHKYCGEARAVVFGEPDLVYGLTRLCLESGVFPAVVACGSGCRELKGLLEDEIKQLAARRLGKNYEIIDDTDFDRIETLISKYDLNVMIGNSDGRRVAAKLGLDLVRVGFPVHDHVGGQRQNYIGYEGSLRLMDAIANSMLSRRENTFRQELYNRYYPGSRGKATQAIHPQVLSSEDIKERTKQHPCFNFSACGNARIHLPVAPRCNIQCNYCSRQYDCANESRPGVTSSILTPKEALKKYLEVKEKMPSLTVAGIAGPGDALANWEETRTTLECIRAEDPNVTFCLSTNGLMLPFYAGELIELGVSHLTVTVNAVDEEIAAGIYSKVNYLGKSYTGVEGARILIANQLAGIRFLAARGLIIKVNIVLLQGINDTHIEAVVKTVKDCGAAITNIMQLIPVKGSPFAGLELPSKRELDSLRQRYQTILPQMYHCRQCRADAIGTLSKDVSIQFRSNGIEQEEKIPEHSDTPLRFAVASKSGMVIDTHFGHARDFYIYDYLDGEVIFVEKRSIAKYCSGLECDQEEIDKMKDLYVKISDCNVLLCMRIGRKPEEALRKKGLKVFSLYDYVENAIEDIARKLLREQPSCNAVNN